MAEPNRRAIFPVLLVNFIGTLGFSIILPFLVFLVARFGGNALVYGVLGATYPALQLVGAPALGKWSDIYGRRKVLLLSQAGTLVSWIIFLAALFLPAHVLLNVTSTTWGTFSLTLPLIVLFLARAADGITGGNISVANAYLADISSEEERTRNFGRMAVSSNLGFIVGPALAGILGATRLGEMLPVLAALVVSLVATLVIAFYLPESKPCVALQRENLSVRKVFGQEHADCISSADDKPIQFRDVLRLPNIPFLFLLYFLIFLGFNLFYTSFPAHAVQGLHWKVTDTGIFFSVMSLLLVIVQGPILSRLSSKYSEASLVIVGNAVLGTNFVLMTFKNEIVIYSAVLLFAVGNGIMWPSVLSILSKVAGDKYQGSVQGFASSFGSLASILGLISGGMLYGWLQENTFLVSAVIIYLSCILSTRLLFLSAPLAVGRSSDPE